MSSECHQRLAVRGVSVESAAHVIIIINMIIDVRLLHLLQRRSVIIITSLGYLLLA